MKKSLLTLLMMLLAGTAFGQTKLDLNLAKKAKDAAAALAKGSKAGDAEMVNVTAVLAKNAVVPTEKLAELGIQVCHVGYGIADMIVPATSLSALEDLDEFDGYESLEMSYIQDAASRTEMHVDSLQDVTMAQEQNLPGTYDGSGVVVGVYDSGIDFNHINFRDPKTGNTRIKEAMLFRKYKINNNGQHVNDNGMVIPATSIMELYTDAAHLDTLTTDNTSLIHGTHTSGIALGSYDGDIMNKDNEVVYTAQHSAAYNSDVILAGAHNFLDDFQRVALAEMDNYAGNRPLVINLSLGTNCGWMDDKSTKSVFFNNFTENGTKPGRIVCMSAGNEGRDNFTIHKKLDESNDYTIRTFLAKQKEGKCYDSDIYYYCNDTTSLEISAECYQVVDKTLMKISTTPEYKFAMNGWLERGRSLQHDRRFYGVLSFCPDKTAEEYEDIYWALTIKSTYNKPCTVRMFQCKHGDKNTQYNFESYGIKGFTKGDATSSFNTNACSNSILSVGSYVGLDGWTSSEGKTHSSLTSQDEMYGISCFSSYTDADDNGIARPDFCAPGQYVISGFNIYSPAGSFKQNGVYYIGYAKDESTRQDNKTSIFGADAGTSMACPNAVSVIALWLQANPQLTVNQVREVIQETADKDDFVRKDPVRFGAGKINALAGLKYILQHYPTAIHDVVNGNPKGLEEPAAQKVIENGRLVIKKNGKTYTLAGGRIN